MLATVAALSGAIAAADPPDPPQEPTAQDKAAAEEGRQAEDRRRRSRDSQSGRADRAHSRARYRNLSRQNALEAGRDAEPQLYEAAVWRGPQLNSGEELAGYLDDYRMRIERGGRAALVESNLPLRIAGDSGRKEPVDLHLRRDGGGHASLNPIVMVQYPRDVRGKIAFTDAEMGVRLEGLNDAGDPVASDQRLFWANAETDTDVMLLPRPLGFETVHQLRSPTSPQELRYEFDLPAGAILQTTKVDGPAGTAASNAWEIVRGTERLLSIHSASAWDAQDEPVPVIGRVEGAALVLRIDHRTGDFAYPIQVDPSFDGFYWRNGARPAGGEPAGVYDRWVYSTNGWSDWWPGYTPTSSPLGFGNGAYGWGAGLGLFTWNADGWNYDPGFWGRWTYSAYGNANIYRAEFGYTYHKQSWSSVIRGIYAPSRGDYDRGVCIDGNGALCHNGVNGNGATPTNRADDFTAQWETHFARPDQSWNGTPGNFAEFRLQKNARFSPYGEAATQFGIGYIYQWDTVAPWFPNPNWYGGPAVDHYGNLVTSGTQAPDKWGGDGITMTARPWIRDDGLGVNHISVFHPLKIGGQREVKWTKQDCGGDQNRRTRPCPDRVETSIQYSTTDLPEGVNTLRARGYDYSGNYVEGTSSNGASWNVKVDRSAPTIGTPSGDLWSLRDQTVFAATAGVSATVNDTYSGVASGKVELIDSGGVVRASQPATNSCASNGCPGTLPLSLSINTSSVPEGRYTVKITGTDQLGRPATPREWQVTIDHAPGELQHHRFVTQAFGERVTAKVNVAHGNLLARVRDLEILSVGPDLRVARSYNSRTAARRAGAYGNGWTMDVGADVSLKEQPDGSVELSGPSGYRVSFRPSAGSYLTPRGLTADLTKLGDGSWKLDYIDQGEVYEFSSTGRLTRMVDEEGQAVSLTYDGTNRLTQIRDAEGRIATFGYNTQGFIGTMSTPAGTHTYGYDTAGNLTSHTDPSQRRTTYTYDSSRRMTDIAPADSDPMRATYLAGGQVDRIVRITNVVVGTGPTTTFTYSPGESTSTDPGQALMRYSYDSTLFPTHIRPDGGPSITLSGSLRDNADTTLATNTSYGLTIAATSGAGIANIEVGFDGGEELSTGTVCSGSCSGSRTWTLRTGDFPAGEYLVEAQVEDSSGRKSTRRLLVQLKDSPALRPPDRSDPDASQRSTAFRQQFGLNSDPAHVQTVNADPAARARTPQYGVPLTSAEVAELALREDAQAKLSIVDDYIAANGLTASYAGTWTDHRNGGVIYIGFTGAAGALHFDAIKNSYPYPDRLRSFSALYSRAELDGVHARIVQDLDALRLEGIVVRSIATMNENNRVEVGVETYDPGVELRLKARYGLSLHVFADNPDDDATRETPYRRTYAGLSIRYDAGDGPRCTAAYSVRSRQPTRAGNYKYRLATAGHCAGKRWPQWFQGGNRIGETRSSNYKNGSEFTSEKIEIDSQLISSTRRRIGKRVWLPPFTRKLVAVENEFDDEREGNIVCISGVVTGVSCGDLKTTNASKTTDDGVKLVAQRVADYESEPGDSGAPIYRRRGDREAIAVGIHQGTYRRWQDFYGKRRFYGHVNNLEQAYDVDVCIVGRCPT